MNWRPCTISVSPIMRSDACWRVMAIDACIGWNGVGVGLRTCVGDVMYREVWFVTGIYWEPNTKPQASLTRELFTSIPTDRHHGVSARDTRINEGGRGCKKVNCTFSYICYKYKPIGTSIFCLTPSFWKTVLHACS